LALLQILLNNDRLKKESVKKRKEADKEAETHNNCELSEYAEDMPLFWDFANEIKLPNSVLDKQV
jgi:hypothetical protein